ncbi:uncharacterized protein LOC129220928 [Uloborus diversus]|uniref:uncharacterized protein LOC129220928 n=1 Tax=Uloborus diversus TaxID=327109 RepID=UPI00240A7264|nr:uncharacterized protein LOC129220928 [Uloborus diversus]
MIRLVLIAVLCFSFVVSTEHVEHGVVHDEKGLDVEANMNLETRGGHLDSRTDLRTSETPHSDHRVIEEEHIPTEVTIHENESTNVDENNKTLGLTTDKTELKKDTKKKNKPLFKKKDRNMSEELTTEVVTPEQIPEITTSIPDSVHSMTETEASLVDSTQFDETMAKTAEDEEVPKTYNQEMTSTNLPDDTTTIKNEVLENTETEPSNENQVTETTTLLSHQLKTTTLQTEVETIEDSTHPTTHITSEMPSDDETTTEKQKEIEFTTLPTAVSTTEDNAPMTVTDTLNIHEDTNNEMKKSNNLDSSEMKFDGSSTVMPEDIVTKDDKNITLSNDLEDTNSSKSEDEESFISRQKKQMKLENSGDRCLCDEPKRPFESSACVGERTTADPNCPCRFVCAGQSGQSCSPGEPCDEEFGLQCNPQNNTCHGPLSIQVFDLSHNSAKVRWVTFEPDLHPQALVFYAAAYRGIHTEWIKVNDVKPVVTLENLLPNRNYYVKVEEDGRQEISAFKTKEHIIGNMPKILVKQKSQTTLTVVWDDFRLPSYHSEYILEYRPAEEKNQEWTKVKAGTQTIVTVSNLKPNRPYQIKVAVWEDEKLDLSSEVITAYTADGCIRNNKMYNVEEEFFVECDFRCVCKGSNETDCSPRCDAPYMKYGVTNNDPMCYEKPVSSDPCCVLVKCAESKAIEDGDAKNKSGECPEIFEESGFEPKACLSDCDHDGDCSGISKCCPSSCGGAVCVRPLIPEDVCEHIYCGPNAKCVAEKISCVCSDGYEGDPHDFLKGCIQSNTTNATSSEAPKIRTAFELDLSDKKIPDSLEELTTISSKLTTQDPASGNELGADNVDVKEKETTEAPFELDLSSNIHNNSNYPLNLNASTDETVNPTEEPDDEENLHFRRPQDIESAQPKINDLDDENVEDDLNSLQNGTLDQPVLFDGCEYNNVKYDRGVQFEDGCEARCYCEGQGNLTCVPRCNVLSTGGPACREIPDPDDHCCKIMVCSFPGNPAEPEGLPLKILSALAQNGTSIRVRLGLSMSQLPAMVGRDIFEVWYKKSSDSENQLSQWNKKLISENELNEVQKGVFEFDINELMPQTDYYIKVGKDNHGTTSLKMNDFSNTVNVKTFPAAVKTVFQGCFHHNKSYNLGEIFYQGCEHKCICREKGFIECQERCAIYIDSIGYEGCDWIPSQEDPCCTIPMCNRRKIPLLPDERTHVLGNTDNLCVIDSNEAYRVGDIWESGDGCKMKICRCTLLTNGSTSIQCQSDCPPLPPNAHIPTSRCPHPVLIKPDGPCDCPYVSCTEAPRRIVQPPRPQCEFKGQRYDMGQEFHDGCINLCHCGQDLRVNCAAIECPYHFSAEFSNCLEWDIDPDFFPAPPHCCAPAKCKNDGSCLFSGQKFENFDDIPAELLPCGARCVCVNGNVTCENRCPPIEDVPPINLPCSPNLAYKGYAEGETCCLQWMCKEPMKQAFCLFQGARYLVSEQWEVRKGSQLRTCICHLSTTGSPEVECRGGCPQIPQRFLLPTEQCLRPVIVTPDDPLMCPYVVCNNTISGQELYNVNVVALNSTAVRIRFTLSNILVGLIGHAELHFTTDPTLPSSQWHVQKFSRPKRLFDSPNIEYILNALRPNTTYFLQVKIKIDALQGGPESEVFKLKMPEDIMPFTMSTMPSTTTTSTTTAATTITTTTTTVPPMMIIDAKAEAHVIDAKTVRISWRNFDSQEKKYIYALQLKYKLQNEAEDKWITTPMIHRDVTSYFLHDLEPSANYVVDMIYTPPRDVPTKIISGKGLEFQTAAKAKDNYHLQVSVEESKISSDKSSFSFVGIPDPVTKYVHVVKVIYKTSDGEQAYSFKVPKSNYVTLDHLKPGKKYLAQLELYLTNGQTLTSNEVEFITKPAKADMNVAASSNVISQESQVNGKQAEPLHSGDEVEDENRAYFIALVVVAVVAAVAAFGFILLLVILVRRQASAKAPISRTPSESAYDNPTYKTFKTFLTFFGPNLDCSPPVADCGPSVADCGSPVADCSLTVC